MPDKAGIIAMAKGGGFMGFMNGGRPLDVLTDPRMKKKK